MAVQFLKDRILHSKSPRRRSVRQTSRAARGFIVLAIAAGLSGCAGELSTLDPAGPAAQSTAGIWNVMWIGGTAIFLVVVALFALTLWLSARQWIAARPSAWIIGGGLIFPGAVLAALAIYALAFSEPFIADAHEEDAVRMRAVGRQWEWRFATQHGPLEAGRLVIPAGRIVHLAVTSEDVIHSFWVPRLAGKIDAVPGRTNVVRIRAPVPGTYQGICAEYCGAGHSFMPFVVEAVPDGADP